MGSTEGSPTKSHSDAFWGDLSLGYLLLGIQPVLVKLLAEHLGSTQIVFLRFAFAAICILVLCLVRGRGLRMEQPGLSALRGITGGIAVYFYFSAVAEVGAARASLLNYTYPLWANLLSLVLGTRPSSRFWWGLFVAFLGVVIVIDPGLTNSGVTLQVGDLKALLSAVFAGISVVIIKQLRKTDESLSIVAAFSAGGLLISAWQGAQVSVLLSLVEPRWAWAAWGVGATSFFGHVMFTRGYRGATVQQATLLSLTVPVIAALLGFLVLGEPFSLRFVIGASMVGFALVFVAEARKVARKKERVE